MFEKNNENFIKLEHLLHSSSLIEILENSIKNTYTNTFFPFEYRIYDDKSKGMEWHRDLSIFDGVYYECVLTLNNTTNSKFRFIDKKNNSKYIRTVPNSLICVLPNTILHSVSPTEYGERGIIKFVIKFKGNQINENYKNEILMFKKNKK